MSSSLGVTNDGEQYRRRAVAGFSQCCANSIFLAQLSPKPSYKNSFAYYFLCFLHRPVHDLYTERCEDRPGRSTGKTLLDDPEHCCRAKVGSLLTELRSRDLAKTEWRVY